jgi:MFS family permease
MMVLVPYVLIEAAGYSGTRAGAALLPFPIILAIASPVMGGVAGRIGPRLPLTIGPLIVAAGFLLTLRIDASAAYWTQLFPAILVIAIGMAGAVAPLTNAVLSAVDDQHTAAASGFNSAVARTGGLIATALLGGVLAARGEGLIGGFHIAMIAYAVCAAGSSLAVFLLVRNVKSKPA